MGHDDAKSTRTAQTTATTTTVAPHAPEEPAAAPVEEEDGGWKKFCWNGDKREICGRTICSWILITIFYLIFFFCLFCFFTLSWLTALAFINPNEPYKQGDSAMLSRAGPGLTVRPGSDRTKNPASSLIWVQTGVRSQYSFWVNQHLQWFKNMPLHDHKNVKECMKQVKTKEGEMMLDTMDANTKADEKPCWVNWNWYGPCRDEEDSEFGYDRGEPCILIKLNRVRPIFGWEPEPFKYEDWNKAKDGLILKTKTDTELKVPKTLVNYVLGVGQSKQPTSRTSPDSKTGDGSDASPAEASGSADPASGSGSGGRKKREETAASEGETTPSPAASGTAAPRAGLPDTDRRPTPTATIGDVDDRKKLFEKYIIVWCDGESEHDKEALGSIQYYPGPYIPTAYFPFKSQTNYQTPFIMLQLKRPMAGALISIVCQAYAKNLETDKDTGVGYARFQVMAG